MPQIRKPLLTILVLAVMSAALVMRPGISSATSSAGPRECATTNTAPPQSTPGPNTGEPDSGSTLLQPGSHQSAQTSSSSQTKFALRALRLIGWSSVIWMKHAIGVGE